MESFAPLFTSAKGLFVIVLFFGGSIFIHELGHYLAAKWRKLKIERFSIGFGPRLFGWKNKDGVDFRISLLPIGGYVALPQLADMGRLEGAKEDNLDEENENGEKRLPPISFTDKVVVAAAGAFFNVLFALAMGLILWKVGQPTTEGQQTTIIGYVQKEMEIDEGKIVEGPAYLAGILAGDIVEEIDGKKMHNFMDIQHSIVTGAGRDEDGNPKASFKIRRGKEILEMDVYPKLMLINKTSGDRIRQIGIIPASQTIAKLVQGSAAEKAGLQIDDKILSINGKPSYSTMTLRDTLEEHGFEQVTLGIERNGKSLTLQMEPMHAAEKKTTVAIQIPLKKDSVTLHFLPKYPEPQKELPKPEAQAEWLLYDIEGKFPESHQFSPEIGDTLSEIASTQISTLTQIKEAFAASPLPENFILTLSREDRLKNLKLPATASLKVTPTPIRPILGLQTGATTYIKLDPFTQIRDHISTTIQVLKALLSPKTDISVNQLSGPIGIGRVLHKYANIDYRLVLVFAVLLNINLAILNLLPIPVLDGGHILFATIAKLRRNGLPIEFIVRIQTAFVLLLFSMVIYVGVFDSLRWKGDHDLENRYKLLQELYFEKTIITTPAKEVTPETVNDDQ